MASASSSVSPAIGRTFRFLDLPPELRDMIYEYARNSQPIYVAREQRQRPTRSLQLPPPRLLNTKPQTTHAWRLVSKQVSSEYLGKAPELVHFTAFLTRPMLTPWMNVDSKLRKNVRIFEIYVTGNLDDYPGDFHASFPTLRTVLELLARETMDMGKLEKIVVRWLNARIRRGHRSLYNSSKLRRAVETLGRRQHLQVFKIVNGGTIMKCKRGEDNSWWQLWNLDL